MKLMRVGPIGSEKPAVALDAATALDLSPVMPDDDTLLSAEGRDLARGALEDMSRYRHMDLESERIGPPLARPGKVVCVGLNYRRHAAEAGLAVPTEPVLFLKAADTVVGPNDAVTIPKGSVKTDYEVELAVIIGRTARYLDSPVDSRNYILGYAISNDVSEREFQLERGGQWDKGKNCETFNPLGPWIATRDEVHDVQDLFMSLTVDGQQRQLSSTGDMVFSVDHIVWYVSQFMTLRPGDVINTGTPEGVGMGFAPARYLRPGQTVEVVIQGLGTQKQRFEEFAPGGRDE